MLVSQKGPAGTPGRCGDHRGIVGVLTWDRILIILRSTRVDSHLDVAAPWEWYLEALAVQASLEIAEDLQT